MSAPPQNRDEMNANSPPEYAVRMENITKRFPGVVANQQVALRVQAGAFHAVIGENGAGKSTLLNILYGRYQPDSGRVFLHGQEVTQSLHSPADAIRNGVGMVSQHYALIPALTVLENVLLGAEPTGFGGVLKCRAAITRIHELANQLQIASLDVNQRADTLSIAAQQKVEILKALYRGANILLLDEPTATLAPQEAESLFTLLRNLVEKGTTVLFVTHKLREVMAHSHAVTVLRAGQNAGDFITAETNEAELLHCMIGARLNSAGQPLIPFGDVTETEGYAGDTWAATRPAVSGSPLLQIEGVTVRNSRRVEVVKSATLELMHGEIVGVAGVDGSGQRDLAEAILGLQTVSIGKIFLEGSEITDDTVAQRYQKGVAYIPEDRHRSGMILDFSVTENYTLGHHREANWGGGTLIHPPIMTAHTVAMIQQYDVRISELGALIPARSLSGGNQQKIVVARAIQSAPKLLVACQPTRGLDVEAARFVYRTLEQARREGLGILLFSLDLEEILQLSDRVAVMFNGKIVTVLPTAQATPEEIGAWMTGAKAGGTEA
ncbi:MAG: ABC transporter ATP-binding protein [Armatimonadetes bacterium]|nr:ABC transporter ATP-binding protein [Armatimonadota bacterium]